MQDLKSQYQELLELIDAAGIPCQSLMVFREYKGQQIFRNDPAFNIADVEATSLTGEWKKIKSFVPPDFNAPFYVGAGRKYLTYQQCLDITEAFAAFEKAPAQGFVPYMILQKANTVIESLAPVERCYSGNEDCLEAGISLSMKVSEDYFPDLAHKPGLTLDERDLYQISNIHVRGKHLINDINRALSGIISPMLREPKWSSSAPKIV